MIHNRTLAAITLGTLGGYLCGSMLGGGAGLIGTAIIGTIALWQTPRAETIAAAWIDQSRAETGDNSDDV